MINKKSHYNITICTIRAHINILRNEEVEKLTKIGDEAQRLTNTPNHLFAHQTPY